MPVKLPEVNLLPKYKREREGMPYFILISMAIVLLAFVALTTYYFITKNKLATVENEYSALSEEVDLLEIKVAELSTEDDDEDSLANAVSFAKGHYIPTSVFILELDDLLPEESYLSEYVYESNHVNLETHFETLDLVADYTTKLNSSPYTTDTKVDQVQTFTLRDHEDVEDPSEIIPRYETNYTIEIDQWKLREAAETDE